MNKIMARRKIFLFFSLPLVFWCASYAVLRATKLLVRREWLEIHPISDTHQREIYGTDVGHGRYFNARFQPKRDPFRAIYFPLWRTELALRGNYFQHDDVVVFHGELLDLQEKKPDAD